MTFGEKLQKLRRESGLSQEKLAEQLHVSRQAISKWELGTAAPDTDNIVRLSKFFQVPLEYLMMEDCTELGQATGIHAQGVPSPQAAQLAASAPLKESLWVKYKPYWYLLAGSMLEVVSLAVSYRMQARALELFQAYYRNAPNYMLEMPLLLPTVAGILCLVKGFWEWWKRVPEEKEPFRDR